jgi:DNA-binding protein WhiA
VVALSFSGSIKEEILSRDIKPRHCNLAFLSAALYTVNTQEGSGSVSMGFDNERLALYITNILNNIFKTEAKIHCKQKKYNVTIEGEEAIKNIFLATGYNKGVKPDPLVIKKDCCKKQFLSAAFLTSGSVSDPTKAYHLEYVFLDSNVASIASDTINYFGLYSKIIKRKANYVVYLKEGDQIVDILNITGAHLGLLEFENVRVLKEVRNNVNRVVNCEAFNIKKTVNAADYHIGNIEFIIQTKGLEFLPDELIDVASVRLSYPECTLKELGEKLSPPVSKSCINHRLKKISIIADTIRGGL